MEVIEYSKPAGGVELPPDVRDFVIDAALSGLTSKQVIEELQRTLKATIVVSTVWKIMNRQGPDVMARWATAKFMRSAALHGELAEIAGERLMEQLPSETDTMKLNAVYGTATDKAQRLAALARDDRRQHDLVKALREALDMPSTERALLLPPE